LEITVEKPIQNLHCIIKCNKRRS